MSTLIKPTDPFGSLSEIFDVDRFFGNPWMRNALEKSFPAVNIKETPESFVIDFAVPGFSKDDFKVKIENDLLTVSAEKKQEKTETKEKYTRKEFSHSSFSRSFSIPESADHDKADAKYENGILQLTLKKRNPETRELKKEIAVK